jgi:hypothetical protein
MGTSIVTRCAGRVDGDNDAFEIRQRAGPARGLDQCEVRMLTDGCRDDGQVCKRAVVSLMWPVISNATIFSGRSAQNSGCLAGCADLQEFAAALFWLAAPTSPAIKTRSTAFLLARLRQIVPWREPGEQDANFPVASHTAHRIGWRELYHRNMGIDSCENWLLF